MEYYWELILKDGDIIEVSPPAVPVIQKRISNKDPVNLRTRVIPFSEIKEFRLTSKPFGQQPLLEAAAQAFNEPMYFEMETPYGYTEQVMEAKWVKKRVTQQEYTTYYGKSPGYQKVGDDNGLVWVGFRLPVHDIDVNRVDYCSPEEEKRLTKR